MKHRIVIFSIAAVVLLCGISMFWLNHEPELFDPIERAQLHAQVHGHASVTGVLTTSALIEVVDSILHKRGGYLSNDIMPPWVFLDNIPSWEQGALIQVRDLSRVMRNDFGRSQTQSSEDPDLSQAEPLFNYATDRWLLPATEGKYKEGMEFLESYLTRLADPAEPEAQFYARADNLAAWLGLVEKRLGSLSQQLSASVGQQRLNTDLSGDTAARQSTASASDVEVKTPWSQIDNVFYEARGSTWALIIFLKAVEVDFQDVLRKKNALVSYRQIIRELESTQAPLRSPLVLNGSKFGMFANHSLVTANYISRANAALIDLRFLLQQG